MFTSRDFFVEMWNSVDPMDTLREGMLGVRKCSQSVVVSRNGGAVVRSADALTDRRQGNA